MANYLKINKKPGWVAPLLFKADVNFSQISNLVFGRCYTGRIGIIPAPQNTPVSSNFQPDFYLKTGISAHFTSNMLIIHHLSSQPDFSQTSTTSSHFPAKSQNRQKCPKFSVSHPQMNNSTSSPHNSIVAHPTPQIWAYFIKSSKQTFWQPQFFFFWHTRNPSKHLPKIFRGQFSNRFFGGRGRAAAIGGGARSYL